MRPVSVHALWLAQDDPKKNTAVLASKRGDMRLHKSIKTLPKRGIILEPLCGKVFGPEDHALLNEQNGALVGLDCSWAHIEASVESVMKRTRLQPRMLPLLLAANPVNWGKPGRLTTARQWQQFSIFSVVKNKQNRFLGLFGGVNVSLN